MNDKVEFQYISAADFDELYKNNSLTGGTIESPLGQVTYRLISGSVCGIGFNAPYIRHNHLDKIFKKDYQDDEALGKKIIKCLMADQPFPIIMMGTPFQHAVWKQLLKIPKGKCFSYQDLAEKLGDIKKVRAIATAVGRNPISWFIPCHRVVPKKGGIGNYLWGAEIKAKLLKWEGCLLDGV